MPRIGAGTAGVGLREAAHVQLVDRRVRPRHARAAPRRGRHRARDDRLRHEGRAVGVVARRPVGHRAGLGRVQREGAVERGRVRVDEELGGVEAMAVARIPGAVRAQAVARARPEAGDEAVEDVAGALRQRDALDLGVARGIEEAQLDGGRVGREDGDVGAARRGVTPSGSGLPGPMAGMAGAGGASGRRERAVERRVLPRRALPAHVGRHRVLLQAAPGRAVAPERDGALEREGERLAASPARTAARCRRSRRAPSRSRRSPCRRARPRARPRGSRRSAARRAA